MKKIILALIGLIGFGLVTNAQTQRGNVMVGGDLASLDLDLGSTGTFKFDLSPKAAWFIKDNVALGGYVNFGLTTAKDAGTSINYGIGALGRYYIADKTAQVLAKSKFFFEANVGISGYNPSKKLGGDNTNGLGIGFGPGFAYFITQNIGLEALLKYNGVIGFGSTPTSNHLTFGLGFQIYLPGKHVKQMVGAK
ncbi:MAG: hypothetical protein J0I41_03825 [Filimonas sp.]|nr:hypothetical protein [Filimonas sp.]